MDLMNSLIGPGYQVVMQGGEAIVLTKNEFEPFSDINDSTLLHDNDAQPKGESQSKGDYQTREENPFEDRIFQIYIGSLSVVGLFILFRLIQKTR
jgi:hypothetical protein